MSMTKFTEIFNTDKSRPKQVLMIEYLIV
jgi:hypothetical protein